MTPAPLSPAAMRAPQPPTVVVVNDDATQRQLLAGLLRKAGLAARPFESAEAALAFMLPEGAPGLIVTDLHMPGLDGWRFCRLLRSPEFAAFNQTPTLVVSATYSGADPADIGASLGANAFLPMPVEGAQFLETVRALLRGDKPRAGLKALVVEDSPLISSRLVQAFQARGYQPEAARTCQEARRRMEQTAYEVVVLDYHLPDGEGDSLLADAHAQCPNCVCVMITAEPRAELALQWLRAGAAAYIKKPFEPEYLIAECERARRERALLRVQDLLEVRTRQLQESEEKYRRLSEDMPVFISTFLPDGTLTYVNRALAALEGTTPEALTGQCFFNLLSPEDRARVEAGLSALSPEQPVETHAQTHAAQGVSPRIIQWTNRAFFDNAGRAASFQAAGVDITGRKQLEDELRLTRARYQAVLETQTDLVCRWLPDTTLTYVNEAYCAYFHRTREELLGARFISFLPEETARIVRGAVERLSGGEAASLRRDEMNIGPQGSVRWAQWVYQAVRDERGQVVEYQSVGRDITGRKLMEQSLRLQHALGAQLNTAKDMAEAMRLILAAGLQFDSIDSGGAYVLDAGSGGLKLIAHHGLSADFIAACSVYPADAPEIQRARQGQMIYGQYQDVRLKDDLPRRAEGLRVLAVLPFRVGGELLALLNLASHTRDQFPDPVRLTLETMRGQLSGALERLQAEQALRKSRDEFKLIVTSQQDLMVKTDTEGRLLFVNPAYCALFGKTEEELLGTSYTPLVHPDDLPVVAKAVAQLFVPPFSCAYEERAQTRTGWRWLGWTASAVRDDEGNVIALIGSGRDISERKQAEEELRATKDLLDQTSRIARVGGWEKNLLTGDDHWSAVTREIHEVPDDFKPSLQAGIDFYKPGPSRDKIMAVVQRAIELGEPFDVELEIVTARGRDRWVRAIGQPDFQVGKCVRLYGTFQDIDNRVRAEQALRASEETHRVLVGGLPDVIMRFDREARHLFVSPNVRQVVDIEAARFIGKTHAELGFPEAQCRFWEAAIRRVFESGEAFETEFTLEGKTRAAVFNWRLLPEHDAQGAVRTVLSISRDISERKQLEQELTLKSLVLDQIQDNVTITDLQGNITYVNQAATRTIGLPIEQLVGKNTNLFGENPEKGATQRDLLESTLREGSWRGEIVNHSSAGRETLLDCRTQVIRDAEGKPVALCGISTDITERKRMEQALNSRLVALTRPLDQPEGVQFADLFNLEEIQQLQDQFAAATGVASIITQPDGTPITEPSHFCRLCSEIIRKTEIGKQNCYQSDAVLGKYQPGGPTIQPCMSGGLWDAGAGIAAGGRHVANWLIGQVRNEAQSEEKIREYARMIGADESDAVSAFQQVPAMSRVEFEQVAQALFTIAKTLSTIAYQNIQQARFINDLRMAEAQLRQSEERYRLIDEASQDLIYSYDRQSRFTHANSRLCRRLGLPLEHLLGKTHAELGFPPDQCAEWARLHQQVYETNQTVIAETITPIQGEPPQYFEVVLNPMHDEAGAIIGIAGTTRDINARKLAEAQIREQLEELRRWHNVTLGREDRILELKRDINRLLAEAGQPPRFASAPEAPHA